MQWSKEEVQTMQWSKEEVQTIQWSKGKDRQYNGQKENL
jgi:hypothetical protein